MTFCLLGAPLSAQVGSPAAVEEDSALTAEEQRLITDVLLLASSGQGQKAAQAVLAQAKVAEHSFYTMLGGLADLKDPRERALAVAYLNTVAHVFASQGRGEFVISLRAFKVLVEPTPSPTP